MTLWPRVKGLIVSYALLIFTGAAQAQVKPVPTTPTTQPGSAPAAQRLTLDQAITVALLNSKALQLSAEAVIKARGVENLGKAAYLPSLSSTFTYTHLSQGAFVTFPSSNGKSIRVPVTFQDQKAIGVLASLPVDIVGQIRAAVEQAQFLEIAARLDYNRTRNDTVLSVKNAYYNVLRAKAFVAVAQQTLQNSQDREHQAELTLKAGTGTRFEVLRAQTDVANAKQGLISAQNQVNLTTATLNNVLGLDQNTPLTTVETAEQPAPEPDFNAAVADAYRTRPEILESDAQIRAAYKGVVLAQRSQLPSLGVTWNLNYTPDVGVFGLATSWAAVATLSVPIFDQGVARAKAQQAKADVAIAKINKQVEMDSVALEVRQDYLAMTEAQDRLNVTTAALSEAQEQYRLAQVRFKAGVTQTPGSSPLLEISDAQAALTQAQDNQVSAQYDLQSARAQLDRAVGLYAYGGPTGPGIAAPPASLSARASKNTGGKS
ncbi:MAG TPA: TolC family protein [Chthonomonadales bacterium]|nr:TolC family protein [Chthonomonadales bacterium]